MHNQTKAPDFNKPSSRSWKQSQIENYRIQLQEANRKAALLENASNAISVSELIHGMNAHFKSNSPMKPHFGAQSEINKLPDPSN
jgi:hypothetical protein